jgi:hypothetical protein
MNAENQSINTTPHLTRSKVKQTALEMVKQLRPFWKCEHVRMSFLERIEAATRAAIRSEVYKHPTKGKSLL